MVLLIVLQLNSTHVPMRMRHMNSTHMPMKMPMRIFLNLVLEIGGKINTSKGTSNELSSMGNSSNWSFCPENTGAEIYLSLAKEQVGEALP